MEDRKRDHIQLAFDSCTTRGTIDSRFDYEPMGDAHPCEYPPFEFLGRQFRIPLWVSSMTGGTKLAGTINHNLARACNEFGMGMGLGSCRIIMDDDTHFGDFDVRPVIGNDLPLYANLGVAQIERFIADGQMDRIGRLLDRLKADGLVVHVNPLQEWLQPEGDRFNRPPIEVIADLLDSVDYPVIVKEVGQGMGPESLTSLMKLPLAAIEFAAYGGTNFAKVEIMRGSAGKDDPLIPITRVGHTAEEMTRHVNHILEIEPGLQCRQIIISGGISSFLDGYYLTSLSRLPAIYGQARGFLRHARGDYEILRDYMQQQVAGLMLARAYLRIK